MELYKNVPLELQIKMNKFKPRFYQLPLIDAIENRGYKRAIVVWSRRAGKDIIGFNLAARQLMRKPCIVYYVLPTYKQAKKVIFDNLLITGERVIDFIPKEAIKSTNSQELKITLYNNSCLQLIGGDSYNTSIVGSNPTAIIFSEFSRMDPRAWEYSRPILAANPSAWVLFISTPYGKNAFWELYNRAQGNKDWYTTLLTAYDTGHYTEEALMIERQEMSEEMFAQEYLCSFSRGVEGSYYAKLIDKAKQEDRIGDVPWDPAYKVYTSWDIGVNDPTCIVWFQVIGPVIRVIDYYQNNREDIGHYINIVLNKPFVYGGHFPPHDIAVTSFSSGLTRRETARHLGLNFRDPIKVSLEDGIEAVKVALPKIWIDKKKCSKLIKALENYHQEWNEERQVHTGKPVKDRWGHGADAFRYMVLAIPKCRDGTSAEELDKRYQEAMYGRDVDILPYD